MSVPLTLLGLLEREPSHGYDLKRDYDAFFGRGKPLPYGQVYATLARLARDGAATSGQPGRDREPERAGTAAQIDDHGDCAAAHPRPPEPDGDRDQELASPARYENAGIHQYPQARELGPADHLLQWFPGCPSLYQGVKLRRGPGGRKQHRRLVLGEDTAGRAEPGDHGCIVNGSIVAHGTPPYY